jgi:hypothetical protein
MTFNGINHLQIMQIELYDLYVVDFVSVCGVSNREELYRLIVDKSAGLIYV